MMSCRAQPLVPVLRVRRSRRQGALLALLALLASGGAAQAQFAVCNQTFDVINVAVGRDIADGRAAEAIFETEGWWTIGPNQCANVLRDELESRYIYVHAQDVFGQTLLGGTTTMCVGPRRFRVQGDSACWQRGLIAAQFIEVDTLHNQRWTLFLSPPP